MHLLFVVWGIIYPVKARNKKAQLPVECNVRAYQS